MSPAREPSVATVSPLAPAPSAALGPPSPVHLERPTQTPVVAALFSPDGRYLAIARQGLRVDVWEVALRKRTQSLRTPAEPKRLAWSSDGARLSVAARQGAVLWDVSTGKELARADADDREAAMFSPDGHWLARLSPSTGKLSLATETGKLVFAAPIGAQAGAFDRFTSDGRWLTVRTSGAEAALVVVDLTEPRVARRLPLGRCEESGEARLDRFYVCSSPNESKVLDLTTGREPWVLRGPGQALSPSLSPDGTRVAFLERSSDPDYAAPRLVEIETGHRLWDVAPVRYGAFALGWTSDGLAVRRRSHWEVTHTRAATGAELRYAPFPVSSPGPASPDGRYEIDYGKDGTLAVVDVVSRRPWLAFDGLEQHLRDLAFSDDGSRLMARYANKVSDTLGTFVGWDLGAGVAKARAATSSEAVLFWDNDHQVAFRAASITTIADASGDGTALLPSVRFPAPAGGYVVDYTRTNWVLHGLTPGAILSNPELGVPARPLTLVGDDGGLHWSVDGTRLVDASPSSILLDVYEPVHGERLRRIALGAHTAVAVAPDAKRAAVLREHPAAVEVWDLETAKQTLRFEAAPRAVAWNVDGDLLLVEDGIQLRILDPKTGAVLATRVWDPSVQRAANLVLAIERDLAASLTRARLASPGLDALLRVPEGGLVSALAWRHDGGVMAIGRDTIELVRTGDRQKLWLQGFEDGLPVALAFDGEGHWDGDDRAGSYMVPSFPKDEALDKAAVLAAKRPGMLKAFMDGKPIP